MTNLYRSMAKTSELKYESRMAETSAWIWTLFSNDSIHPLTFHNWEINYRRSKVTNYDANLSERISSSVIVTYNANISNFYKKNNDANLET